MDSPTKLTKKRIQTITHQLMNPALQNVQEIHNVQNTNEEHISTEQKQSPTESQTPKKHKSIAMKQQKNQKKEDSHTSIIYDKQTPFIERYKDFETKVNEAMKEEKDLMTFDAKQLWSRYLLSVHHKSAIQVQDVEAGRLKMK
ncbi:hypothetical protein LXL04_018810 [Taraxacum kok-saghyz]